MAVHKLSISDFDEIDFKLIAIHTAVEDYYLAFLINKHLPVLLSKNPQDINGISQKGINASFSRFSFENHERDAVWTLIQNKSIIEEDDTDQSSLFKNETLSVSTTSYLMPEFKTVDYFLKIDNDDDEVDINIERLHEIGQISALYEINPKHIKSKNNIIF